MTLHITSALAAALWRDEDTGRDFASVPHVNRRVLAPAQDPEIIHWQNIQALKRIHKQHFGGPTSNAFDGNDAGYQ
jgi:hypothetical protein